MRFLAWFADYGRVCDWAALGEGPSPAQNPPPLKEDEAMAWNFYNANATAFVREFGLMTERLRRTGLGEAARDVFIGRLSAIHQAVLDIRGRLELEAFEKGGA